MNKKNYIKTPTRISNILPKVLQNLKKNNGTILLEIKMNWEKMLASLPFVKRPTGRWSAGCWPPVSI